jgi:DNA-binding NtrC family response regulator
MTTLLQRITNAVSVAAPRQTSTLRVLEGADAGAEIRLPAAGVVVGADVTCDVVLRDPAVSRKHASIVPAAGGFEVADLGSRNGTWLDGVKLTRAVVPVGSTLRIGATTLQLLPAEDAVPLPPSSATEFGALRGTSTAMRQVFAVLERASLSEAPILLLGESGTGKELAARAVHEASHRSRGPFVVFDCGAASESLIEAELFGHKRGAFTGAHVDRIGAFAQAHKGTLFLDEIGDLPLPLQPKLLRLLERGEVTPLGATKSERFDVRIVAATHRDLWGDVARGTFRGDLYYRLAVVEVHMPALRQRTSDIPDLVQNFLRLADRSDRDVKGPTLDRLLAYSWPGNVRELRNVVARAVALSPPDATFAQMPILLRPEAPSDATHAEVRADVPYNEAKEAVQNRFDRAYFADLLRRAENNMSQAARLAGLERKHLYRLLERAGVSRPAAGDDD